MFIKKFIYNKFNKFTKPFISRSLLIISLIRLLNLLFMKCINNKFNKFTKKFYKFSNILNQFDKI